MNYDESMMSIDAKQWEQEVWNVYNRMAKNNLWKVVKKNQEKSRLLI